MGDYARRDCSALRRIPCTLKKLCTTSIRQVTTHVAGESFTMQQMMLSLMGAVAQFERSMINERAAEGREAAKAKGVQFGRKPTLSAAEKAQVIERREAGESVARLAIDFDVSRQAVYRVLDSRDLSQ